MDESAPFENLRPRKSVFTKSRVKKVRRKLVEETTGVAAEAAASEVVDAIVPELADIVGDEVVDTIAEVGAESVLLATAEWITSEILDAFIGLTLGAFRLTKALYGDVKESGAPGMSTFRAGGTFLFGVIGAYIGSIIGKFVGGLTGDGIGFLFGDEDVGEWASMILTVIFGILVAVTGRLGGMKVANRLIDQYKHTKAVKMERRGKFE